MLLPRHRMRKFCVEWEVWWNRNVLVWLHSEGVWHGQDICMMSKVGLRYTRMKPLRSALDDGTKKCTMIEHRPKLLEAASTIVCCDRALQSQLWASTQASLCMQQRTHHSKHSNLASSKGAKKVWPPRSRASSSCWLGEKKPKAKRTHMHLSLASHTSMTRNGLERANHGVEVSLTTWQNYLDHEVFSIST